ncbi:MAG: dockerin type I repeat-containing protein, partial [bacterium]
PVFIVCPGGDAEFEVHLRDECNNPVPNINSVWVELYACEGMTFCPDQPPLSSIPPLAPSDAAGVLRFVYAGGGCDGNCVAVVKIPDGRCDIATVPVRSYDVNGDLGVALHEFNGNSPCCDYNGNGVDDNDDYERFVAHQGHYCGMTECERFSTEFNLTPETDHVPGTNVQLDLVLTNNNFDSCFVGLIEFYYSPSGSGQNETSFHSEFYDQTMAPGAEDTISLEYTVPSSGDGCLIAKIETDCCSTLVVERACLEYEWHCTADTAYCYEFKIFMFGTPVVDSIDTVMRYLNPDWPPLQVLHWPSTVPVTDFDSVMYRICTSPGSELGDESKMFTHLFEGGATKARTIRNAVVITKQTGDCNGDCLVNITDAVYLIQYIFSGGGEPLPYRAGDVNCDGVVNITDAVYIIQYIFSYGPEPCLVDPFF